VIGWCGAESLWGAGRRPVVPCGLQRYTVTRTGRLAGADACARYADSPAPAGER